MTIKFGFAQAECIYSLRVLLLTMLATRRRKWWRTTRRRVGLANWHITRERNFSLLTTLPKWTRINRADFGCQSSLTMHPMRSTLTSWTTRPWKAWNTPMINSLINQEFPCLTTAPQASLPNPSIGLKLQWPTRTHRRTAAYQEWQCWSSRIVFSTPTRALQSLRFVTIASTNKKEDSPKYTTAQAFTPWWRCPNTCCNKAALKPITIANEPISFTQC